MINLHHSNNEPAAKHSVKSITLVILAITLVLTSLSIYESVLSWVMIIIGCSGVIRGAIYLKYYKHLPTIRTLNLLALLSILGLVYSSLNQGILEIMVNLLVLACALKLMQARLKRDVYQLVISLFFVIGTGFIFNQSLVFYIFYSLMSLVLLVSLACFQAPSLPIKQQTKIVLKLSLQALPISILLFLALPHLPPLWQVPTSKSFETGLTDEITPGDIAQLSQSSELAFRATFQDRIPEAKDRYWRAIVLEEFDGKTWRTAPLRKTVEQQFKRQNKRFSPILAGPSTEYDIIVEPTHQSWLFALDLAIPRDAKSKNNIWQSSDFRLENTKPLLSKHMYSVRSYPHAMAQQSFTQFDKRLNLTVPETANPETRKWVAAQRKRYPKDADFINALLSYFTQEPFVYTLRPKLMSVDPIDTFLFEEQAGFCSHYASALAFMLRLGDIPARVVTGYQGGELTQKGQQAPYLSIYQYDAHAWVETWTQQTGWKRIDPTALVSPDRIEFGLQDAMQQEGSFLSGSPFSLNHMKHIPWLNKVRLFLTDLDYDWSRFVLGFDDNKQHDLFKLILGKVTPDRLSILGLGIFSLVALMLGLFFLPHWLIKTSSTTQRIYGLALAALEKAGTIRPSWQAPHSFCQIVQQQYPQPVSQAFADITKLYLRLQYQNAASTSSPGLTTKQAHKLMTKQLTVLKKELAKIK
ncbi:transglutaminaseTgpA domain-containing protein [Paraglaciecola sp. 2405UD69-4]|uniref:transglutaminase family protein n=1 Tax=Paraglaciecola sp. 2405UD69-4 TaxID=3391836 RepID=UPI0039C9DC7B